MPARACAPFVCTRVLHKGTCFRTRVHARPWQHVRSRGGGNGTSVPFPPHSPLVRVGRRDSSGAVARERREKMVESRVSSRGHAGMRASSGLCAQGLALGGLGSIGHSYGNVSSYRTELLAGAEDPVGQPGVPAGGMSKRKGRHSPFSPPRARREGEASLRFDNIHASSAAVDSDADVESGNRTI